VASLFVLLWACAEPRPVEPVLALDGSAARGEAQYQMVCARCHGASGGGAGRTPAVAGRVHALSDADVVGAMLNGRGAMGRTGLTDRQAADVLAYLRATFPAPGE
jgi:mono/diheme cytochrome c family protein